MRWLWTMAAIAAAGCGQPAPPAERPEGAALETSVTAGPRSAPKPAAPRGVRYDDERLTVDGEPFFPYGVLWRAAGVPLTAYRDHRLNVFLSNGKASELDEADRLGLKTLLSLTSKGRVTDMQDDPTLIGWYVVDDAKSEADLERIRAASERIRDVDPHRPIFGSVIGHSVERNAPFVEVLDVPMPYRYPFPRRTLDWYREYMETLHAGSGKRAYWTAIQSSGIYSQNRQALGISDGDMRRFLTPAQLRLLVWTLLETGCRGLFYWPDHGLFDGSDAAVARALEVARIGLELEVWGDILVMGDPLDGVGALPSRGGPGSGPIRAAAVRYGDDVLVLASADPPNAHEWVEVRERMFAVSIPTEALPGALPGGELRAFRLGFPAVEEVPLSHRDGKTYVNVGSMDVTGAWLVTSGDGEPWTTRVAESADDHRRFLAESVRVEGAAFARVIRHVVALGYVDDVPPDRDPIDKNTANTAGLESARREWRRVMTQLQANAKARLYRAAPGAENLWLSPHTLPAYYGSLMDTAAR